MDGGTRMRSSRRLSALDEEAKGIAKAGLQRYLGNPRPEHSPVAGRSRGVYRARGGSGRRACSLRSSPTRLWPRWARSGALLTYGILAEIGNHARAAAAPSTSRCSVLPFTAPTRAAGGPARAPALGAWPHDLAPAGARRSTRCAASPKPKWNGSSPKGRSTGRSAKSRRR